MKEPRHNVVRVGASRVRGVVGDELVVAVGSGAAGDVAVPVVPVRAATVLLVCRLVLALDLLHHSSITVSNIHARPAGCLTTRIALWLVGGSS
ncbi:MAG: hypothetical protein HYT34_02250 [Candidatus Ryanbacteria bacterium]|nr:hypothetical protein [Candidatus Ryanbacteria bacterium]